MRSQKMNGYVGELRSTYLSCEKDLEAIVRKLFVESNPYSDDLKRLLCLNTKDCLRDKTNQAYKDKINALKVSDLIDKGYIRFTPTLELGEHEEVKSYIIISFDKFSPSSVNEYYKDSVMMIDVICNNEYWYIGDFQLRPLKICGIIDGLLNGTRLSGIGKLESLGCDEIVLNGQFAGYCLTFKSVHGNDDNIPLDNE